MHNALYHLEDCSLPHEHWNREAELAAVVALLRRESPLLAARRFAQVVSRFLQSYRRVGVDLGVLDEHHVAETVQEVAVFRDSLPADYSDADIYVALLARDAARPAT